MKFQRLKKPWHGRGKGSVFATRDAKDATIRDLAHSPVGWQRRPLYYMDGKEVHKGALQNGKVVEGPAVDAKGDTKRGYQTTSQTCMELTPSKAVQREELAKKIDGGTVLELQAGKGNLSTQVYAPVADKLMLVDKSKELRAR